MAETVAGSSRYVAGKTLSLSKKMPGLRKPPGSWGSPPLYRGVSVGHKIYSPSPFRTMCGKRVSRATTFPIGFLARWGGD